MTLHVVMTAGEASGDTLGARLMRAMKAQHPDTRFSGIGGPLMAAEGLESLFPIQDLSVMGIAEVLPRLPKLLRRIDQAAKFIEAERPDIVITVDSPDFSFRVAHKVREKMGVNRPLMVHYVAPTVWAWRPERARKVAALYDGLICLFPFEPPYFTREGMSAIFAGHPAMEDLASYPDQGRVFRDQQGIPPESFALGFLAGSRAGEMKRTAPVLLDGMMRALAAVGDEHVHIVAPTLPHLEGDVRTLLKGVKYPVHVVTGSAMKWGAFASMDAAGAVSGTVGLELAIAGVPHLIAYRMNPVTWAIVDRKVTVKYAHLANILLDDLVVPEFIQDECRADAIADAFMRLFTRNASAATMQRTKFFNLRMRLAATESGLLPSEQAASYVLKLYQSRSSTGT